MRISLYLCVLLLLIMAAASAANAREAKANVLSSDGGFHCVAHPSGEQVDSWLSDALAQSNLPGNLFWPLRNQAWQESRFQPLVTNTTDSNAGWNNSVGLLQVTPLAWNTTATGKEYPFWPCSQDAVLSARVRGELFSQGRYN